jgi:EmrB/QacA subfamily drug resistance transporter
VSTNAAAHGPANRWYVLVLVCFAQFMVILDATIVNVALPAIQSDLDFTPTSLQWVVNAYALCFGGFLLLGGRAADIFGRQRLFLAGIVVFTAASLLNGIASTSEILTIGRGLQGFGAALVSPAALSIVSTTFAEGRERTRALGIWSAIAAGGGAVGLLLGGILTDYLSWRWVFFVNVPIGIVTFVLSWRSVPNTRAATRPRTVDVAGAVTVTSGLIVLVFGIVKAQEYGWGSGRTIGLLAASLVLLASFVLVESRSKAPLIRLGIFRTRSLSVANASMAFVASGMFGLFYLATLYLQGVLGYSPLEAGLAFLPVTAGVVIGAGAAQKLIPRLGVRVTPSIGLVLAGFGLIYFARVPVDGAYLLDIFPGLTVMSFGIGLTFVPMTLLATSGVASDDAGLASGLFNTSQQIGGALGLSILSTVAASKTADILGGLGSTPSQAQTTAALVDGYQVAFVLAGLFMFVAVGLLNAFLRRRDVAAIPVDDVASVSV